MSKIFTLSEAASIALHSMVLIADNHDLLNVNVIAERSGFSKHHLAKVLQQLVKAGFLRSVRGPKGGFKLTKDPQDITFLEIYEEIEGKVIISDCPMGYDSCFFRSCILDTIVQDMTVKFREFLESKKVSDFLTEGSVI